MSIFSFVILRSKLVHLYSRTETNCISLLAEVPTCNMLFYISSFTSCLSLKDKVSLVLKPYDYTLGNRKYNLLTHYLSLPRRPDEVLLKQLLLLTVKPRKVNDISSLHNRVEALLLSIWKLGGFLVYNHKIPFLKAEFPVLIPGICIVCKPRFLVKTKIICIF